MANALYDAGREGFLGGDISWSNDDIAAALLRQTHTPDLANHVHLDDIPGADILSTSPDLTGKTITAGVADANDITFSAVTGQPAGYVLLYQRTTQSISSRLIALIDTATGLPVTPDGSDIEIKWDGGPNKIFKL